VALESALNGMSPSLQTAWQNVPFTPVAGTPYQRATLLFAEPDNLEKGAGFQEMGFLQVDLFYPQATEVSAIKYYGANPAESRAEMLRTTFKRGATFSGIQISRTPEIKPAYNDGDRFVIPIRIRFHTYISA
jgi:hypothetical protein